MTAPLDAEAVARERVLDAMPNDCREVIEIAERDLDAYREAVERRVRADLVAKVEALMNWSSKREEGPWVSRDEVLEVLRAAQDYTTGGSDDGQ